MFLNLFYNANHRFIANKPLHHDISMKRMYLILSHFDLKPILFAISIQISYESTVLRLIELHMISFIFFSSLQMVRWHHLEDNKNCDDTEFQWGWPNLDGIHYIRSKKHLRGNELRVRCQYTWSFFALWSWMFCPKKFERSYLRNRRWWQHISSRNLFSHF